MLCLGAVTSACQHARLMGTGGEGLDVRLEGRTRSRFRHLLVADCVHVGCAVWAAAKTWNRFKQEGWHVQLGA